MPCYSTAIAMPINSISAKSKTALLTVSDRDNLRAQLCLNVAIGLALTVPLF